MDYEKKLALAKEALESGSYDRETIEYIFPELKESEDERIRNEICIYIGAKQDISLDTHNRWLTWLEKQGESKPTDIVEPKFHKGDWIVREYTKDIITINQVVDVKRIDDECFGYTLDDGTYFSGSWESSYHLWTIQDAKDGDVLACENGWTYIFRCLNDNLFSSHCFMDSEGWFCEYGGQGHTLDKRICGEIHPATKKQRNLLFQKMKEVGYMWDDEKKEPKKIEQKPTWTEEDERLCSCLIEEQEEALDNVRNDKYGHSEIISDLKEMYNERIDWLKSLKQRMKGE